MNTDIISKTQTDSHIQTDRQAYLGEDAYIGGCYVLHHKWQQWPSQILYTATQTYLSVILDH